MTWVDVLVGFVDAVEVVSTTGEVWGPVLACAGLTAGGWRMRPRSGRHRTPSAGWTTTRTAARTVTDAVRSALSALVHRWADDRPPTPDATTLTCTDGSPATTDEGPPPGGHEDGNT